MLRGIMNQVNIDREPLVGVNFMNGKCSQGAGKNVEVISPYTGSSCGELYFSEAEDIQKIVQGAKEAQKAWALTPLKTRSQIFFKFRKNLLREQDEISQIISLESGKTLPEAKAGLMKGIEVLEYALSLQNADVGGKLEVSRGVFCEYRREPLGVVASITPFNFPAMVPMWTMSIAMVLGNAYIWKPSEKTPFTAIFLAEALKEAGLPEGILSIVQGDRVAVESLIDHPEVKAVAFVGSTKIAKLVYTRATSHGKRALCLGGAKNHIILLPDADLEVSGIGISDSYTGCAGQRCMAASVLLAVGDVDKHIEQIKKRSESLVLGESMGAIISKEQCEFLNAAIEKAVKEGASVLLDGREHKKVDKKFEGGFWLGPTILDNVKADSEAARLELFGPIIAIIRCQNISEAIAIENASPYGNAASVFTSSGPMAEHVASRVRCGMFGINIGVPVPREPFSFGGTNDSKFGHGDITGEHSLNFWTNIKKVTTKWEAQTDATWMS